MSYVKQDAGGSALQVTASSRLIDYYYEITEIEKEVGDALVAVNDCCESLQNEAYKGEAEDSLNNYFATMYGLFYKMCLLYSGAGSFVLNTLSTFTQIDEDTASSLGE